MSVVAFLNKDQVALWEFELKGQISDGHWENSIPHDHWIPWCHADGIVDPTNLGRDFYARRERYNFASKELLDVVENRMIGYVRLARVFGIERVKQEDMRWCVSCEGGLYEHNKKNAKYNIHDVNVALAAPEYTRSHLVRDLKSMGQIIKMYRQPVKAVANV